MHHFTYWTLFISRINRAWLYKGHEDSDWQLNVDLAQLVGHWPRDPKVLVSIPTGGNFWRIFFCSSLCKDLSDNLTETPIVKNSNEAKMLKLTNSNRISLEESLGLCWCTTHSVQNFHIFGTFFHFWAASKFILNYRTRRNLVWKVQHPILR